MESWYPHNTLKTCVSLTCELVELVFPTAQSSMSGYTDVTPFILLQSFYNVAMASQLLWSIPLHKFLTQMNLLSELWGPWPFPILKEMRSGVLEESTIKQRPI